jgi:hypothetical protein
MFDKMEKADDMMLAVAVEKVDDFDKMAVAVGKIAVDIMVVVFDSLVLVIDMNPYGNLGLFGVAAKNPVELKIAVVEVK